jgi:hypothetical protein
MRLNDRIFYRCTPRPLKRMVVAGSVATVLLLSSCKRHGDETPVASRSGPEDPNLRVSAGGYHGHHFTGPVYIPRSSPMADGTTAYNVSYQDDVTVVSKDDATRHLVRIGQDGSYVFDSSAASIAAVKPGSVLLLSGLALRSVVDAQKTAEGYSLKTGPAMITDAIKNGRLEGTYKIDFSRMQASVAEYDVDFSGYNYHVKFTPGKDRIAFQATIKFGSSQGVLAYEGIGYLSNFVATFRMQIKDGQLTNLDFNNSNLTGQIELKWYAVANEAMKPGSMAKVTSWPTELLKSTSLSKAAYHVPIVVGAVPFDLRISLGFSFIPAFTSKDTVLEGRKLIKYSGRGGFVLVNGQTRPSGTMVVEGNVTGQDNRVVAAGPVGFTVATEAPRLELSLGWPPAKALVAGYLNFITSYGIVTNGLASPKPCQTNIMAFSVSAGDAYTSPDTFAAWTGTATGVASSVSLWSKTFKSPGALGLMCPG